MKPVSRTAYYCGGVRMLDAESSRPLIGDRYAKRLLGEEGIAYWEEFKHLKRPNSSNTVRHFLIDSFIRKEISDHPDATIILIGAGLDSRAYRLNGGNWIEIDEPAIIEHKNRVLPVSECSNPLLRLSIDFESEKLKTKLSPYTHRSHVVFIIEGVLMYLDNEQKNELLSTLTTLFPRHVLYCDLMTKKFWEKLAGEISKKLAEHGAVFKDLSDEPSALFLQYGYVIRSMTSMLRSTHDLGLLRIPWLIRKIVLRKQMNGYAVYEFTYGV